MAVLTHEELITNLSQQIKENGNQEITGSVLNLYLKDFLDSGTLKHIVLDAAARNSIVTKYVGMRVFVTSEDKSYTLKSDGATWSEGAVDGYTKSEIDAIANGKVDKVGGKVLTSNDFTNPLKSKLDSIEVDATKNDTDANLRDRSTHTGTQATSTITGLDAIIADILSDIVDLDNDTTKNADNDLSSNAYFLDEDNMASDDATKVASQQSIKKFVEDSVAAAAAGGVTYKGGYDASSNTPDLDTTPSGVKKGDMYTVTASGTFFTIQVDAGDVLIAEEDDSATEVEWTIVEKNLIGALLAASNLSDVANAVTAFGNIKQTSSTTVSGVSEKATQTEVNTGTDNIRHLTALLLQTKLDNFDFLSENLATGNVGGSTTTLISAFDFAGGTTVMSEAQIVNVPAGTYLVFFNATVDHSSNNDSIDIALSIGTVEVVNSNRFWSRPAGSVSGPISIVAQKITLGSIADVSIHWIETSGGTASAYNRNLTLLKVKA